MKLRIREDFESITSIGTEYNSFSPCIDMEKLGFVFTLASNDIHTIHVNACGENFKELHESADALYHTLGEYADSAFEISCEDGHYIHNINDAKEMVPGWQSFNFGERGFDIYTGTQAIIDVLDYVNIAIYSIYEQQDTDVQSVMDEWRREVKSQMNYFLKRVTECKTKYATESIMLRNTRHDRKKCVCEHLDYLKLGQPYKMFCQVEDHIDDYNCDTVDLKKGDYVIRDFQFGHLPNGGNKGYIPYEVVDIEYDRDDDTQGYYDARKRLHLFDGFEDFYVECYNERFNGIFHKLKKSSVKK